MGRSCCVPTATCAEETNSGQWHNVTQARQVTRDRQKRQTWLRIQRNLKHGSRDVTSGTESGYLPRRGAPVRTASPSPSRRDTGKPRESCVPPLTGRALPGRPASLFLRVRAAAAISHMPQRPATRVTTTGHTAWTWAASEKNRNGPLLRREETRSQPRRPRRIISLEGRRNEEAGRPCNRPRPFFPLSLQHKRKRGGKMLCHA